MSGYSRGGGGGEGDQTINSLPARDNYGNASGQPLPPSVDEVIPNERDLIILQECQRDSVKERCAPFAAIGAGLTHFAVHSGKLAPHPRYGSLFKVMGASLVGFILGKMSYMPICREKFKADPLSALGQKLREKEGGYKIDPAMTPATTPGQAEAEAHTTPSYEELRRRNRQNAGMGPVRTPAPPAASAEDDFPAVPAQPETDVGYGRPSENYGQSMDQPSLLRKPRKRVNAYGDELEDV